MRQLDSLFLFAFIPICPKHHPPLCKTIDNKSFLICFHVSCFRVEDYEKHKQRLMQLKVKKKKSYSIMKAFIWWTFNHKNFLIFRGVISIIKSATILFYILRDRVHVLKFIQRWPTVSIKFWEYKFVNPKLLF